MGLAQAVGGPTRSGGATGGGSHVVGRILGLIAWVLGYGSDEGGCLALGRASDGWMRNPHRGSLGNGLRSTGR